LRGPIKQQQHCPAQRQQWGASSKGGVGGAPSSSSTGNLRHLAGLPIGRFEKKEEDLVAAEVRVTETEARGEALGSGLRVARRWGAGCARRGAGSGGAREAGGDRGRGHGAGSAAAGGAWRWRWGDLVYVVLRLGWRWAAQRASLQQAARG